MNLKSARNASISSERFHHKFMRTFFLAAALLAVALSLPFDCHAQANASPRERILLDSGWRFHLAGSAMFKNSLPIAHWRYQLDPNAPAYSATVASSVVDTTGSDWHDAEAGDDVFDHKPGYAWFRASLPAFAGPGRTLAIQVRRQRRRLSERCPSVAPRRLVGPVHGARWIRRGRRMARTSSQFLSKQRRRRRAA